MRDVEVPMMRRSEESGRRGLDGRVKGHSESPYASDALRQPFRPLPEPDFWPKGPPSVLRPRASSPSFRASRKVGLDPYCVIWYFNT